MRTVLIDDEALSLSIASSLLSNISEIRIIGKYTDARKAMTFCKTEKPDVVFLDIEMPEMNGIELARKLIEAVPHIQIVFLTAYKKYAVDAFELNAVDYLTKPVQPERLLETINRLKQLVHIEENRYPIICCFYTLRIKWSDKEESINIRWRTKKTEELFALLLCNRGNMVQKEVLVDILWPHLDWERGLTLLYSTVYQLRRTLCALNCDIEIKSNKDHYVLKLHHAKIDVYEWERQLESLPPLSESTLSTYLDLVKQYKGDFLEKHEYSWEIKEKKRLRLMWLVYVEKIATYLMERQKNLQAINLYHYVQDVHPQGEESYKILMELYSNMGRGKEVMHQYNVLCKMMEDEYGLGPSVEIREWYDQWRFSYKNAR